MSYPVLYKKNSEDFTTLGNAVIKNASDLCVHQVLNGEYTAEFHLPANDSILKEIEYDDFIKIEGQLFRIRTISSERNSNGAITSHISCCHVWYDACDCKYIPHTYTKSGEKDIDGWIGVTPRYVLEQAFADTPFTIGEVELEEETDIFATKSNPAEIVTQLIENVGGILDRDNYTLHLRRGGDQYNGKAIVYGKNLKSIEKTMDDTAVITRLYPLGRDDMDISSVNNGITYIDSPLKDIYGYVKCGYRNFPEIEQPAELLEAAQKLWSTNEKDGIDKPKIQYTLETADFENISMGHTIRVTDRELDIDILTQVVEITHYPLEPNRGSVVLSNHIDATKSISEKILSEISNLEKITDNNGNIMSQYIDNVRKKTQSEVEEAVSKRLTLHEFGDIWVDNTDNPTKAMVITDGIFAAANSKKSNGDWDWRTIGTADQFMADTLNAPWLNAGYIDTDKITIRSSDGNTKITGNEFIITTNDGFEAAMSANEGFKYIYTRDNYGNPYDYTLFNHKGQQRYWHGNLIPSTYQFAKGTVNGFPGRHSTIELKGSAWQEIAKIYNEILNDPSLTDTQKKEYLDQMLRASVAPTRISSSMSQSGAVVLQSRFLLHTFSDKTTVPVIYEIQSSGTTIRSGYSDQQKLYYDGAAMMFYGSAGYIRGVGLAPNECYGIEAVYDIAVTLDIDYT